MVKDKIAILGASGFIGMHLCKKLVDKNIKILALIRNKNSIEAKKLLKMGAKNVLIKGGHLSSKKIQDIFVNKKEVAIFNKKRIFTKNTHGTGCTLSSAITVYYSCGKTLKKSCEMAINYVNHAIKAGPKYGKGHGPINHLVGVKINKNFK